MPTVWTVIAAFGTGTIVGSIVALLAGRWTTISNLRQKWIDGLREDLSTYFTEIEGMHFESVVTDRLESEKQAKLVYRRILLRLNIEETLHVDLAEKLEQLLIIGDATEDEGRIDGAVTVARRILKQEWEVVKYGGFAKSISRFKKSYKGMLPPD